MLYSDIKEINILAIGYRKKEMIPATIFLSTIS